MENQNQQTQTPPQSSNQMPSPVNTPSGSKITPIILGVVAVAIITIGAYVLGTKQNQTLNQRPISISPTPVLGNFQTPSPTESLPKKTLIKPTTPGKYTNEEYGYSIEFPEDWELYGSGLPAFGQAITIFHPQCKGAEHLLPERTTSCVYVRLPEYEGGTGWGYGNNRQVEEKIILKDNITANKITFYYDDYILVSWTFDKDIPKEYDAIVAFAYANEDLIPGSLETVSNIISSLNFKN